MSESETYDLLSRTKPIEEHVERLHAIWGEDHGQIRHHLYRAVASDVRWASTSDDPEHEAHTAALLAVAIATDILRGAGASKPGKLSTEKLLALIDDLRSLVETDDSAEGHITYHWSEAPGVYDVSAVLRTGNSLGQGGMLVVDDRSFPAEAVVVSDHDGAEGVSDET